MLEGVIPKESASDFNQGLIELGALICVPNGMAKCEECPVKHLCRARKLGKVMELPVKTKAKARRIEKRTIFIFQNCNSEAPCKRAVGRSVRTSRQRRTFKRRRSACVLQTNRACTYPDSSFGGGKTYFQSCGMEYDWI